MSAPEDVEHHSLGKKTIRRVAVAIAAMDGTVIRGYSYELTNRSSIEHVGPTLLCLPSDTGNTREFHEFALAILALKNGPKKVLAFDMRGRGRSDRAPAETYSPLVEADDVISVCDALGLHNISVLASAGSALTALLVAPKRPCLIDALIFNDGGPERDGVGVARTKAIYHQMPEPENWDDAVIALKKVKANQFPILTDKGWLDMAKATWQQTDGRLLRENDPVFSGMESRIDFDQRQPMLWIELKMFAHKKVMLIHGENSLLLTKKLANRMRETVEDLRYVVAEGQGHTPLLATHGLPQQISKFLNETDQ